MGEGIKTMLAKPIKLADQVAKQSGSGQCFRPECKDLRARAEKLAELLRQAARADLYERPAERIVAGTMQMLNKAVSMATRCFESHSRLRRFLSFNPVSGFPRTLALLDTALEDVAWLIRISSPRLDADQDGAGDDDDLRGMPNIAQNDPILFLIWDHIARLHTGSLAVRADSASTLASLARDNPHFAKLIVEEEGVVPLVKLLKEGTDDGQEARTQRLSSETSKQRKERAGLAAAGDVVSEHLRDLAVTPEREERARPQLKCGLHPRRQVQRGVDQAERRHSVPAAGFRRRRLCRMEPLVVDGRTVLYRGLSKTALAIIFALCSRTWCAATRGHGPALCDWRTRPAAPPRSGPASCCSLRSAPPCCITGGIAAHAHDPFAEMLNAVYLFLLGLRLENLNPP